MSVSILLLSLTLAAGSCDAEVVSTVRQLFEEVGSEAFDCPSNVEGDLCAILLDPEAEPKLRAAWDERLTADQRRQASLRVRGGVVAVACAPVAEPSPAKVPVLEQVDEEEPELRVLLRRALAFTGASVFDCPASMRDTEGRNEAVCAFYEGSIADFEGAWTLPEDRAQPLSAWVRGQRRYRIDGREVRVIVNNGVAAAVYPVDP